MVITNQKKTKMKMIEITHINETKLEFGYNQQAEDPRDGLVLFGPNESLGNYTMRVGVIGLADHIQYYSNFVKELNKPIYSTKIYYGTKKTLERQRPSFPGFESVFNINWPSEPECVINLDKVEIETELKVKSKILRTNNVVDLFLSKIVDFLSKEDNQLDIWMIIVPQRVYDSCKPNSWGKQISTGTKDYIEKTKGGQTALAFEEFSDYDETLERVLDTVSDFHNLLKARLIQEKIKVPVQIILERTIQFKDKVTNKRFDEYLKANFAWTISTTIYYKLGKLPWKLDGVRDGVCYIGLVFKKNPHGKDKKNVCSAAQMFLKDGDGSVFRGNIGLWESEKEYEYHLDLPSAEELIGMALDDYKDKWKQFPDELFIHSKTYFNDNEWAGFEKAVSQRQSKTKLVGILIKDTNDLKLYREPKDQPGNYGVLRGTALIVAKNEGFLCTKGFIPRLNTSNSLEMPRNLRVKVIRGEADIRIVLKDILSLTKLNYNACVYGDGIPVTLKFSNKIGSILTALSEWKVDIRQFKYYI